MVLGGSKTLELTWFAHRNTWKKKYRGEVTYIPVKTKGKTDAEGYKLALEWWKNEKARLDGEEQQRIATATGYGVFGDMTKSEYEENLRAEVLRSDWEEKVARINGEPAMRFEDWKEQQANLKYAAQAKLKEAQEIDPDGTVDAFANRFLTFKRNQVKAGKKIGVGRWNNIRDDLKVFKETVGVEKAANRVNWGVALFDYYTIQLKALAINPKGDGTAVDRMQVARQFIRHLWENNVIDLPRNIDSKEMVIHRSKKKLVIPPMKVFQDLLKNAPDKVGGHYPLKLYLLLMANCGMTQIDISDLLHTEVDWKRGTITRKRSKTEEKNLDNIPTVQYKLWPLTFKLLKENRSNDAEVVLIHVDGGRLRTTTLSETDDLKSSNTDLIADRYNEWIEEAKVKHAPTLKFFRKRSASQLAAHAEYNAFAQYFLAQSDKTVAENHYIVPSQKRFDAAIAWLGKEYGLIK